MKTKTLLLIAAMFSLSGILSAGEILDIKGSFDAGLAGGFPVGWLPNKPSWWDDAATVALNPIDGTEKQALQVTSANQGIHLCSGKQFNAVTGDQCLIRAMVKGNGTGLLGVYTYPGCGMSAKTFFATEEWTEFVADVTIPNSDPTIEADVEKIRIVLVVNPNSSIEFSDVTAEITSHKP
ncbi:MAG: hypothetical protein WC765_09365 [Phycisphaerae bacterium]|jgi:hypothetical protein